MMTKQEERAALAKIEKIIKAAGPDSYIGMAFAGCCEIAADNIENDFGNSLHACLEAREKELKEVKQLLYNHERECERLERCINRMQKEADESRDRLKAAKEKQLPDDLYIDLYLEINDKMMQVETDMQDTAEKLSYCDPANEADRETIASLIKRLQEDRPRRDSVKALLARLEAVGAKEATP